MSRKLLQILIGLVLILIAVAVTAIAEVQLQTVTTKVQNIQLDEFPQETDRASCSMYKCDPSPPSFGSYIDWVDGFRIVIYFDPTDPATAGCGTGTTYPFEINGLAFPLYSYSGSTQWPVTIDLVMFDMAVPGDKSAGPGTELCRQTKVCTQIEFDNTWGSATFDSPCCVNGPFFVGFEVNDPGTDPFPALIHDQQPVVTDDYWFYISEPWPAWSSNVGSPGPGYPLMSVNGADGCGSFSGHKMHFPQLPDEFGWGITSRLNKILADDWQCSESGPVRDLHFWGKWFAGIETTIDHFDILIYADIPADPPSIPFSQPGQLLWQYDAYAFATTAISRTAPGGWYSPETGEALSDIQQDYFQYDIYFDDPQTWFEQVEGTIYWIQIAPVLTSPGEWGWMASVDHFNDNAIYWDPTPEEWIELWEPGETSSNIFALALDFDGMYVAGFGNGAYVGDDPSTGGWFLYENANPDWWNVWFWDHPLDHERIKDITIEYSVSKWAIEEPEMSFEITPNWSTDLWTLEGMPQGETRPPLPDDFDYTTNPSTPPESDWIGRGDPPDSWYNPVTDQEYTLRILDYNPEWVSVDVRGYNARVDGTIYHTCRGPLDMAFVITADANASYEGACCYPEPTGGGDMLCTITTQEDCENNLLGTYRGHETSCYPMEACCLPNGDCIMADPICCETVLLGAPMGTGSACTALEACCFSDGSCMELDPLCCVDMGGTPQQEGSDCASTQCPMPCECEPGNANGYPGIDILDIVHIINYKYKGGSAPTPYALCSGDSNCDCKINILDVIYVINNKYKFGPEPCSCNDFLDHCGEPLR